MIFSLWSPRINNWSLIFSVSLPMMKKRPLIFYFGLLRINKRPLISIVNLVDIHFYIRNLICSGLDFENLIFHISFVPAFLKDYSSYEICFSKLLYVDILYSFLMHPCMGLYYFLFMKLSFKNLYDPKYF